MHSPQVERLIDWDQRLCANFNRASRYRGVRNLLRIVSRLGDGVFWYALMVALLATQREAALRPVLQMIAAGVIGLAAYKWLKRYTLRPRPYQVNPDICVAAAPLDQFSFPSGHTLHAVSFSVITVTWFPALAWVVVPFALLVALSRPVLGLHYPSDVLAGATLGAVFAEGVMGGSFDASNCCATHCRAAT